MGRRSDVYKKTLDLMLYKKADDSSQSIIDIVNEEGFNQFVKKYPDLIEYILGVETVEKIDDSTVLSSLILSNGEIKLIVPVIYAGGKVDSTSYIYNPDTDIMLGLTKKLVKYLFSRQTGLGKAVTPNNVAFETENIRNLFVPPRTWAPKVANNGFLPQVLEAYPEVREKFLDKLANDETFRESFKIAYGDFADHLIKEAESKKLYSQLPEAVFGSYDEIRRTDWLDKEAALNEYTNYGIAISHGGRLPSKSLVKVASVFDILKNAYGIEGLEVLGKAPGCFNAIDAITYSFVPVLVLPRYNDNSSYEILGVSGYNYEINPAIVGVPDRNCMVKHKIKTFSVDNLMKAVLSATVGDISPTIPRTAYILIAKDGKMESFIPIKTQCGFENSHIQIIDAEYHDRIIVNIGGMCRVDKLVIMKNSDMNPLQVGNILTIGDKNLFIYTDKIDGKRLLTFDAAYQLATQDTNPGNIIKLAYDGVSYYLNGREMPLKKVAEELLSEGFDKYSIYKLVKEAKDNGSTSMQAVDAKLDMLTKMIMTLVGDIKKLEAKLEMSQQPSQEAPVDEQVEAVNPDEIAAQLQPYQDVQPEQDENSLAAQLMAQQQAQQQQEAIAQNLQQTATPQQPQDVYSAFTATPTDLSQIDMDQAMGMPQDAQTQDAQTQDVAMQQQGVAPDMQAQDAQQQAEGPQLVNGMNPAVNPDIVQQLMALKDSNIMDTSFLSTVLADTNVSRVIEDQLYNILMGINGLAKVTFNIQLSYNALTNSMGDSRYKKILNNFKTLLNKTTDVYVDLASKREQYKTQEDE